MKKENITTEMLMDHLIKEDEMGFYCIFCGHRTKKRKPIENHIEKKHMDKPSLRFCSCVENIKEDILENARLEKIKYAVNSFNHHFKRLQEIPVKLKKLRQEFADLILKGNHFADLIRWRTIGILKLEAQNEMVQQIIIISDNEEDVRDFYKRLIEYHDRQKERLFSFVPDHNSTCPFTNENERIRFKAKTDLFQNLGGHLYEMKRSAETILELEEK